MSTFLTPFVSVRIRWRNNDPAEGYTEWTKVHLLRYDTAKKTLCGLVVPEFPYMEDRDNQIDESVAAGSAIHCKRCEALL